MTKRFLKAVFLVIVNSLFFAEGAGACIFRSHNKSGASPFWPSNQIELCFLPAKAQERPANENPLDAEYLRYYNRNINVIKNTIVNQINGRTPFNIHGFNECDPNNHDPKIRIDLNAFGGGTGAIASSIGPMSSRDESNLTITTMNADWPGGVKPLATEVETQRIRTFNDARHISWVSLHETLHLLGLHHTEEWDGPATDPYADRVIQYGEGPDSESIMTRSYRNYNSDGVAQLSSRDVQCLSHIANRSIMQFPQRRVFMPERTLRVGQPASEKGPSTSLPVQQQGLSPMEAPASIE